jgi:hypothetical protein
MTGRPSTYTEEMGNLICDKLTEGVSLRKLCESDKFPNASTVYVWLDRFPSFADKYTRAREAATEDMLEDILEIADDPQVEVQDKRVRIDTRKWIMGKLKPKKYGDTGQKEKDKADEIAAPEADALAAFFAETILAAKRNSK